MGQARAIHLVTDTVGRRPAGLSHRGAGPDRLDDGVRSDALVRLARGADLHVQCCYLPASALTTSELKSLGDHTLACSDTAGRIAAEARAKQLVLTHFRSMTPAMLTEIERDVGRDFDSPVAPARDLDEFAV